MSTLTKAFVVLVTILSVVLVALVVPFVAQTQDHAKAYQVQKIALAAALAAKDVEMQDMAAANAVEVTRLKVSSDAYQKLSEDLRQEREGNTDQSDALARSEADFARQKAANLTLAQTLNAVTSHTEAQSTLIRTQLTELATAGTHKREAQEALEVALGDSQRLRNHVDRLNERMRSMEVTLKETAEELYVITQEKEENGWGTPGEVLVAVPDVEGSITSVDQIGGDITLVQINVGTRDKIEVGMTFTVSRGDEYVGSITIQNVDTANAVGEVTMASSEIRAGDRVSAGH